MQLRFNIQIIVICAIFSANECKSSSDLKENKNLSMDHNLNETRVRSEYFRKIYPNPDDVPVQCKKLKAKRWLSDGFCHSVKPVIDDVCIGSCLPLKELNLPWWSEFIKYWSTNKVKEYRCVEDRVKRRKVRLVCKDSTMRTYTIKVVKSCKCKAYKRPQNTTEVNRKRRRKHHRRRSRRRNRKSKRHLNSRRNRRRFFRRSYKDT